MTEAIAGHEVMSLDETRAMMRKKLRGFLPEFEIDYKAEFAYKINKLKKQRNAVILGHNYMEPALYCSVPDYTGDSLELSRVSAETEADIIVFCGVRFMAETAKILNPQKMVLLPSEKALCSLAGGITVNDIRDLKKQYPGVPVVTYVNTYAEAKAESDYCCTSGNAAAVVRHLLGLGHEHIMLLPDEFLARNTAKELGMNFMLPGFLRGEHVDLPKGPTLIGWRARCEVHELFRVDDIQLVRKQHPGVKVLAHPECSPEVCDESDFVGSTKQLIAAVERMEGDEFLLLTECTMGDNIAAAHPEKHMLRLCSFRCPHMNQITMEDTLEALEKLQYQIELPADIIERARKPIDHMLAIR
jgi:quinolinate synthase